MGGVGPAAKLPEGWEYDSDGFLQYFNTQYGCWMHPVLYTSDGQIIYELQPKQWDLARRTPLLRHPGEPGPVYIGYGGSAGSAKSHTARALAAMAAQNWPGSTTVIIRETLQMVHDNHVTPFMREVPKELYDINLQRMEVKWSNDSLLHFRYLRFEKDLQHFQGPAYDFMIFEEATLTPPKLAQWLIGNRLRATVDGTLPFAVYPTNPGGPGHQEFRRKFVKRAFRADENPDDYDFVQAKLDDNYVLRTRDPGYARKLNLLPEPHRSWMRDGNFDAGAGSAFDMLDETRHFVDFFVPPPHWVCFGGFDWGYQHPFSFGFYAVNEDGDIIKCDTITGMLLNPPEIADRIIQTLDSKGLSYRRLQYVAAGHDCWNERKAEGLTGPTVAERLLERGLPLVKADTSRIAGANNLREYLSWQGRAIDGGDTVPGLRFMDTPGNRKCFVELEAMVPDPNNLEDVLKVDADEFGEGGDDRYDETRYAVKSRPARAASYIREQQVQAWSPAVLRLEAEEQRRVKSTPVPAEDDLIHPEFGAL